MKDYIELIKESDSFTAGFLVVMLPLAIPLILIGNLFKLIFKK
jgi:hypothetical protein